MNPLIKELASKALKQPDTDNDGLTVFDNDELTKFAELIIHECAIAMSKIPGGYSAEKYYESNKIIKQHFGVE